jgi:hypothetical protein
MPSEKTRGLIDRAHRYCCPVGRSYRRPKKDKRKQKDATHFYRVTDDLLVTAIYGGEAAKIEPILDKLSARAISHLKKTTIWAFTACSFRRVGWKLLKI